MSSPQMILVATLWVSSILVAGCSPGPGQRTPPPGSTAGATVTSTVTPLGSGSPPGASATASAVGTTDALPSASSVAAPPAAYLGHDTVEVEGQLRTYCWLGSCADVFELPPMTKMPALALDDASTELQLRLHGDAPFINWQASYGDGAMADLVPLDRGGEEYDPDTAASLPPLLTAADFGAPPSGTWIVYVVVRAVEGDAHHAWQVSVP